MTSKDFVKAFHDGKENFLNIYFERNLNPNGVSESHVGKLIKELNLDAEKQKILIEIIDGVLIDTNYSILLGLDGCASIGNELQQIYEVRDEEGNKLTGDLEGYAYDYFHGEDK